jgi:hypothetical protein
MVVPETALGAALFGNSSPRGIFWARTFYGPNITMYKHY